MAKYRINGFDQMKAFYKFVFNNQLKVRPTHVSLYMFLLNQNNRCEWIEWFGCPFDLGMHGSCIGSRQTYYRTLRELKEYRMIDIRPGKNANKMPYIKIIPLLFKKVKNDKPNIEDYE